MACARGAQRLDRDLGEGEEQQATAVRGHMALLAELLAMQRARLDAKLRQHALEAQVPSLGWSRVKGKSRATPGACACAIVYYTTNVLMCTMCNKMLHGLLCWQTLCLPAPAVAEQPLIVP